MSNLPVLLDGVEHRDITIEDEELCIDRQRILFRGKDDCVCLELATDGAKRRLITSYYIGVDWLCGSELAVRVQPKFNGDVHQVDHLAMLFGSLKHADVAPFALELYQIDFDAPTIPVRRQDDSLTPFLVAHFLYLLQSLVRRGLKKGYNSIAKELHGKVKGKIEVGQTLRQGTFRQRPLVVACRYDEFSFDIPENRTLKRALSFARRFLGVYPAFEAALAPVLGYCEPAFALVSDVENGKQVTKRAPNPLYRAYDETLRMAHMLLRRFGNSMTHVQADANGLVAVPPHWIDMSKLFELYVLGLLKDRYGKDVRYENQQQSASYGLPDYTLNAAGGEPWIVDAKYKPRYQKEGGYHIEDIRQLSGYAHDKGVLSDLGIAEENMPASYVSCLIIYPEKLADADLVPNESSVDIIPPAEQMKDYAIGRFTRFYKLALRLPQPGSKPRG
jgi:5-methylcytosine-specific restriction enzyme subunit McrC